MYDNVLYSKRPLKILLKNVVRMGMNNKLLAVLLIGSVGFAVAHCHAGYTSLNFNPCYISNDDDPSSYSSEYYGLPTEKQSRRQLYWLYAYNPRTLELANFPIDYFIANLTDHIKSLESKIVEQRTGLTSNAMLRGVILSIFSALCGRITYDSYKKGLNNSEAVGECIMLSAVSAFLATIAGTQFDRVRRYTERLVGRLERDKNIRDVLEQIKTARV